MGPDSHFLDFSLPLQWLTLTDIHGWNVIPWQPSVNQRQATRRRFGLVSLGRAGENVPLLAWALSRGQLLAWQIKRFVTQFQAADQEALLQRLLHDHPQRDVYLAPQPEAQVPEPMEELTKVALQEMDGDNLQSFRPEKERYLGTLGVGETGTAARRAGQGSAREGGPSTAPPGPSAGGLQEDSASALAGEGDAARGEQGYAASAGEHRADGEGAPGSAGGMPKEPTPLLSSKPVPRRDPLRSNVPWMETLLPDMVPATVEACRCNRVARQHCWTARYVVRLPAGAEVPEGFDAQHTKSKSWVPDGHPRGQRIAASGTEHEAAQLVLQWLWAKHCVWTTSTVPDAARRFLEPCPGCRAGCPVLAELAQGVVADAVPGAGPQPGAGRGRQRRGKAGPQPGTGRGKRRGSKRAAASGPQHSDPARVDQEACPAATAAELAQPATADRPGGPAASLAPPGSSSSDSPSDSDSSSSSSAVEPQGATSSALPPAAARAPGASKATPPRPAPAPAPAAPAAAQASRQPARAGAAGALGSAKGRGVNPRPSARAPNATRAPLLPPRSAGAAASAPSPAAQPATRRRGLASAAVATTAAPTPALGPDDDVPLSHFLQTSAAAVGRGSRSSRPRPRGAPHPQ